MTTQRLFNKIVRGLLKQGKKSKDGSGFCKLRGRDNTKCAVGFLITDKQYNKEMELGQPSSLLQVKRESPINRALISSLQYIHDWSHSRRWSTEFKEVAKTFCLKMPKEYQNAN